MLENKNQNNMFDKIQRKPIYTHTHLTQREIDAVKPLMESAFNEEFGRYGDENPLRSQILKEKKEMMAAQFANRMRIAKNMGVSALNEDAKIFAGLGSEIKQLFESYSAPNNIINMGNVVNPDSSNQHAGGIWNPNYKAGSGDIPSYVFGLQSHLALHCIGFDLMPTIAVDTPKVVISYIDTVYGGGKFDDVANHPSFIDISNIMFTRSWIETNALKRATTKMYFVAKSGAAVEARFIVGSTVKASVTAEILSTGTFDGGAYTVANTASVGEIIKEINGDVANANLYLDTDLATAIPFTAEVGLNYTSAIRTNIAEASGNNNKLGGMTRAEHEQGPKYKLNVVAMDKQLEMIGKEIEADTTNIQIKDFAAMGVNVISHLYTGVQNQLVQTLDEIILDHLYRMGVEHAVGAYESQGINHSLYIDTPANPSVAMADINVPFEDMLEDDCRVRMGDIMNSMVSTGYENQMTHADRLYARILLVAEFGAYQNRIAPYDFIVVSGTTASCLKKNATFATCPHATTLASGPELSYSGTVHETVAVYNNPRIPFNDPRILFGRRGNDTDPGSKFLAYDLASSRQTIAEGTMAEKIRVWSRFAIADIGFYPELNYYTMVAINKFGWA